MARSRFVLLALAASALAAPSALARTEGPDCRLVFEVYAHAVAHRKADRFIELSGDYAECVLEKALRGPGRPSALLTALEARRQLDEDVRRASYGGRVRAHPLVVKAGFQVVRALSGDAKAVYVSSLVRSPDQQLRLLRHPVLGRWAARRSKHVLGGLAVDIAFVGRRRSMAELGRRARRALSRELGEEAGLLRVVVEKHCLHVELSSKHPVARRVIEDRKAELVRAGILKRARPGIVPSVADYVTEAAWRRR